MANTDTLAAAAAKIFEDLGWPTPEEENWRRTPLQRLLPKGALDSASGAPVPAAGDIESTGAPLLPDNYAARIITVGGRPSAISISEDAVAAGLAIEWVEAGELPEGLMKSAREELENAPDRITAWHWRDLPGSLVVHMPRRAVLEKPVVIEERLMVSESSETGGAVSVPHVHVEAEESASVEVVWSMEGAPEVSATPVVNAGLSASAEANSRIGLTLRQTLGPKTALFVHDYFITGRDARIEFRESHLGGALVKTRARAVLGSEGSDVLMKGLYVAAEGRHMDLGTLQEHRSPRATSDALYKGAVHPGGRSVFSGLIEVSPKAFKTDAYLTNKNLILGDGARADSIPQLNILTDDVKCSHGSTTGKLDETQLFYLQARGFSPEEAKRELTRGFLAEVLDGIPDAVAEFLHTDLDAALANA